MNFYARAGKMAIGSRIRQLAAQITADASKIYSEYKTDLNPKWFPVFFCLATLQKASASEIVNEIGHSHVSVSKILAEMKKAGLIGFTSDSKDARKTLISLTRDGKSVAQKIEEQYRDVTAAIENISSEAKHDLWAAIGEWEKLLSQKSLVDRVIEQRQKSGNSPVIIENFKPKYKKAFSELNRQWITEHFKLEKPDIDSLDNPKSYILDRGGEIFVATIDGEPVGVCAMIPMSKGVYELAKMAVSKKHRGKNIGWLLGQKIIDRARERKAKSVYLESNTILKPAIGLYKKLGFKKIKGPPTPYERCNIQMEIKLR